MPSVQWRRQPVQQVLGPQLEERFIRGTGEALDYNSRSGEQESRGDDEEELHGDSMGCFGRR